MEYPDPASKAVSITCMAYTYCCVYIARLLMMDKRNCSKHVEFCSKNKFVKLVHLVGVIIRLTEDMFNNNGAHNPIVMYLVCKLELSLNKPAFMHC